MTSSRSWPVPVPTILVHGRFPFHRFRFMTSSGSTGSGSAGSDSWPVLIPLFRSVRAAGLLLPLRPVRFVVGSVAGSRLDALVSCKSFPDLLRANT